MQCVSSVLSVSTPVKPYLVVLIVYLCLFVLEALLETILEVLNARYVQAHAASIPAPLRNNIDRETYDKTVAYTLVRNRFGLTQHLAGTLFVLAMVLSGALGQLDILLGRLGLGAYLHGVVYVFVLSTVFSMFSLPFDLYGQFVIEARFGFNKMSIGLFFMDKLKGTLLSAVIMTPLLLMLFWFMDAAGTWWWLYAFGAIALFQLILVVLYPALIAPLFNKFTPLEEGALKTEILAMADKMGFKTSGIFVMDGSRRSKHSNAYFTGLFGTKRIVLYDTLIAALSSTQVTAVLAHEIGHEKLQHIKKGLAWSLLTMLGGLFVLSLLITYHPLFTAFGFTTPSYHAAIVIFGFCSGPATFLLRPLFSWRSRTHEYAADAFAREALGSGQPLSEALLQLSTDNLSNLTPHPWYSFFHYSHPTLLERIRALGWPS